MGDDPYMTVRSVADIDRYMDRLRDSARKAKDRIATQTCDPLELFHQLKFSKIGFHPVSGNALNLLEQINQTWTYATAFVAARQLLSMHPEAGGLRLAPGAHASIDLDIMSEVEGLVGAEVFAAVTPTNNKKLAKDLAKMANRHEQYRYVFFGCPDYSRTERRREFDRDGVEVWSVAVQIR